VVWKLDRLGGSVSHLVHVVAGLRERGVQFVSLTEGFDTTTPQGRLLFHILAALAEMERELIRERTLAGIERSRPRSTMCPQALRPRESDVCPGQLVAVLYSSRLAMYCTIPSGTRYQIGSPPATRCRHPVEEIASAGISTRLTLSSGRPRPVSR
jgi:hypothetical protein